MNKTFLMLIKFDMLNIANLLKPNEQLFIRFIPPKIPSHFWMDEKHANRLKSEVYKSWWNVLFLDNCDFFWREMRDFQILRQFEVMKTQWKFPRTSQQMNLWKIAGKKYVTSHTNDKQQDHVEKNFCSEGLKFL
jgi:hypothetical protein